MSRLMQMAPASKELLELAGQRGDALGAITSSLLRLIDRYGATVTEVSPF